MKQAICLLCFGDVDKILNFIKQFEDHPDINIYVHYHGCDNINKLYSCPNIRYVMIKYRTCRFSCDMVRAELALYEYALQDDPDNVMFHLMSESDYLICSPQYFVDYFNRYKDFDFITYVDYKLGVKTGTELILDYLTNCFPDNHISLAKASQQKSLSRNTAESLMKFKEEIEGVLRMHEANNYHTVPGAVDELIIPTIMYWLIGDKSLESKRYINWENSKDDHPNTLLLSDYNNESSRARYKFVDSFILQNQIVRKIDFANSDSVDFLKAFKIKFKQIEKMQREKNNI